MEPEFLESGLSSYGNSTGGNSEDEDISPNSDDPGGPGSSGLNPDGTPVMTKPRKKLSSDSITSAKARLAEDNSVTLAWQELSVYVPIKKVGLCAKNPRHRPFKRVLNNVTGVAYPGSLVAVMGASGAGKTTLLNVLAYRAQGNLSLDGEILANGIPVGKFMSHVSGYVYQDDLFYGTLTVSEHLHFMASMKLDRRVSTAERKRRVEELLVELSLKKCQNTRIGVPGRVTGISGGERKRLAFATEILTDPPLLFLDECTTGLDSFSAQRIVGMMRVMAAKGKTILCTIHQPSSQIFAMFDQLCLLAEGRTAYMGKAQDALPFLEQTGFVCPEHFNPADYIIRTLAVFPGKEEASRKTIKKVCDSFTVSDIGKTLEANVREEFRRSHLRNLSISSNDSFGDQFILGKHIRPPLWWSKTLWLLWRSLTDSYRNPEVHVMRTIQKFFLGFLIGFCFFGLNLDQEGIQNIQGVLFVFITESTFPAMYGVVHVFPLELPLFLRENKSGLYRVDSYYLSKIVSLIPGYIFEPIVFITFAYWMIGLRTSVAAYLLTCLLVVMVSNTASACGCLFSASFDSVSAAMTCLIPVDYILMITGGIFINLGTIPDYISWIQYFSWFRYANEALSTAQWEGVSNITCPADQVGQCYTTGEQVLASRSFYPENFPLDLIGIATLYTLFHLGAFCSLLVRSHRK